jgi:hypothetical protein
MEERLNAQILLLHRDEPERREIRTAKSHQLYVQSGHMEVKE